MVEEPSSRRIRVEVLYALPQRALSKILDLDPTSSVADALRLAAQGAEFAGIELKGSAVGIFGKIARAEHVLQDGDRIEIYRLLTADPKTARRERAQQASRSGRS
jgi:uncharacterized protein